MTSENRIFGHRLVSCDRGRGRRPHLKKDRLAKCTIYVPAQKRQSPDFRTRLTAEPIELRSRESAQIIYWKRARRCR